VRNPFGDVAPHPGGRNLSYATIAVVDHPSRRRIYEHLLRVPGDHFRAIVRALRLSVGVVRHHLSVLIRAGLVSLQRAGGRVRYYPRGGAVPAHLAKLYERHWKYRDLRFRVLLSVHALRAAPPAKVARALGISRQLAAYHLSRLAERGQLRFVDGAYRPA
jgi:predicted transcriptional regulator